MDRKKNLGKQSLTVLLGCLVYAVGINLFIVPLDLYSSGVLGLAQLVSDFLCSLFPSFVQEDLNGVIFFAISMPMVLLAWRGMGHPFMFKTIIGVTGISFFLSVIPVPVDPFMPDYTAAVLFGGAICGTGCGIILSSSAAGGGLDALGLYLSRRYPALSVGRVSRTFNSFLILIYIFKLDITVALYTFLFIVVQSIAIDRSHRQNITVRLMIFTKCSGMDLDVMKETARGMTEWNGMGAYTGDDVHVLVTVISKYELEACMEAVHRVDPEAFVIADQGVRVVGNFQKRL